LSVRALVVWAPDWPVIAAEKAGLVAVGAATAVMHADRVLACSATARLAGVRRGMRKRDSQRVTLLPFGDERRPALTPDAPWPGGLPDPLPARLIIPAEPITVLDATGTAVTVTARLHLSAVPQRVHLGTGEALEVVEAHGPWPADERWWDQQTARRLVWVQLVLADGRAALAELSGSRWCLAGWFD
jgi:protein ImuB